MTAVRQQIKILGITLVKLYRVDNRLNLESQVYIPRESTMYIFPPIIRMVMSYFDDGDASQPIATNAESTYLLFPGQ